MSKLITIAVFISTLAGATRARAEDKIVCDPASKKLEWHVCVLGPVEYKRGMKTETREECKVDKIVKPANGCDFGDLTKHVPDGADPEFVRFYAIAPEGLSTDAYEYQSDPPSGWCRLNQDRGIDGWELMKFSQAFDKSNAERAQMVKDNLKKKKKALLNWGITFGVGPQGCQDKTSKMGVIDQKTLSQYLYYATVKYTK